VEGVKGVRVEGWAVSVMQGTGVDGNSPLRVSRGSLYLTKGCDQ
jgi:hypothetical protein